MKLAICTDVFADLSYTDMLDKVKSLGIDAVWNRLLLKSFRV